MSSAGKPVFERLRLGSVHPAGWLRDQLIHDLEHGFASRLDALTEHARNDLFAQRIGASDDQLAWWDSETRGNWLWGYTLMAYTVGSAAHQARVSELLRALMATQDADGYLGIYAPDARYQHGTIENGELWAQGRALLALLTWYEFTGEAAVLQAVERAARLTMTHYGPGRPYFRTPENPLKRSAGMTHGLCYVDAMAWLYALTGSTEYRDFGVWLYDDFCALPIPFVNDDMSTRTLGDPMHPLTGHAVHTAEHLRTLAWALHVTGREDLRAAFASAVRKLARFRLPSGVLIGDESIHGMPTPDFGYEYCTITEDLLSQAFVMEVFGQRGEGDLIESLLFNAGQGARLADGSAIAYLTTDTRLEARADRPDSYSHFHGSSGRYKFSPTHEDIACCCNPNATRVLSHYIAHQWMRTTQRPGLAALLYGAGTLRTSIGPVAVEIEQITDYPFDEAVTFIVRPAAALRFGLHLRIPGWARGFTLQLNGAALDSGIEHDGFAVIEREWQAGDRVEVRFEAGVELRPYPTGEAAILRGPLQYVLPIESERRPMDGGGHAALHDIELTPKHPADARRIVPVDDSAAQYGLTFVRLPAEAASWHTPAVQLVSGEATLVPIGCTMLRRAAFPLQRR